MSSSRSVVRKLVIMSMAVAVATCVFGKTIFVSSSANDGDGSLRVSLAGAEDGDVIRLTTTAPIKLTSGLTIPYGRFGALGLTLEGIGDKRILDGGNSTQILNILPDNKIVLSNLILKNGRVSNAGGAICNDSSSLTICNCEFIDNVAEQPLEDHGATYGGALYNSDGNVQITNCVFSGSYVNAERYATVGGINTEVGGAICSKGGSLKVNTSNFNDNWSRNNGGAVFCSGGILTLENCSFKENISWSPQFGANASVVCCLDGEFEIYDSDFTNNSRFTNAAERASFLAGTFTSRKGFAVSSGSGEPRSCHRNSTYSPRVSGSGTVSCGAASSAGSSSGRGYPS